MLPGMSTPNLPNTSKTGNTEVYDQIDRFELFFATKWPYLWRGAMGVFLAVAVVVCINAYHNYANESVAQAFAKVHSDVDLSVDQKIAEFEKIVAANPNRLASVLPFMELGYQYADKGEFDKAITAYENAAAVSDVPDFFKLRAQANIAYVKELQGKKDEALADYQAIADANVGINTQLNVELEYAIARLQAEKGLANDAAARLKGVEEMGNQAQSAYSFLIMRMRQIYSNRSDVSQVPATPVSPVAEEADTVAVNR